MPNDGKFVRNNFGSISGLIFSFERSSKYADSSSFLKMFTISKLASLKTFDLCECAIWKMKDHVC